MNIIIDFNDTTAIHSKEFRNKNVPFTLNLRRTVIASQPNIRGAVSPLGSESHVWGQVPLAPPQSPQQSLS